MSKTEISVEMSGAELLKIANGRSAARNAARAEIFRRVEKRHEAGKSVKVSMQRIANLYADALERAARADARVVAAHEAWVANAEIEAAFAAGATWADDGAIVSA